MWQREIRLALVGPLVNLALAGLAAAIVTALGHAASSSGSGPFCKPRTCLASVVWANLYIAILNLMPAYPLDGGRIVRAFFSRSLDLPPPRGAPSPSAMPLPWS